VAVDCAVQQTLDGGHLPAPTDQIRLSTLGAAMLFTNAQQAMSSHWLLGTLNTDHLRFTERRCARNQPRG
jgi:hypothetical protein